MFKFNLQYKKRGPVLLKFFHSPRWPSKIYNRNLAIRTTHPLSISQRLVRFGYPASIGVRLRVCVPATGVIRCLKSSCNLRSTDSWSHLSCPYGQPGKSVCNGLNGGKLPRLIRWIAWRSVHAATTSHRRPPSDTCRNSPASPVFLYTGRVHRVKRPV